MPFTECSHASDLDCLDFPDILINIIVRGEKYKLKNVEAAKIVISYYLTKG